MIVWSVLLIGLGAAIVLLALLDMGQTVISIAGRTGAVTDRLSGGMWWVGLWVHRRVGGSGAILNAAGPVILVSVIGTWIVMLVVGWSLVFGAPEAVIEVENGEPTAVLGRLYYASALVVGRGSPDFRPSSDVWRAVEQVAALSGLALLSLSIAYVLPVVGAAVTKRRTAAYIATLGGHAEEVLARAWDGSGFGQLDLHIIALTPRINDIAEQHLAYPVLHYFHSSERHSAIGPNIAVLDEVLTVLKCCAAEIQFGDSTVQPLRWAIREYLDTLIPAFIVADADQPPRPGFEQLREVGVPVRAEDDIDSVYAAHTERRARLHALVRHHGWEWATVAGASSEVS